MDEAAPDPITDKADLGTDGDGDEAGRLALARLTEKVATLSNINQRLEEQLQKEEVTAAETTAGPHVCVCRAAVTELLDFDPQSPRILHNIEVDQIVQVDQVCLTKSGQPRGRLRDGGWVSMVNREGVVQFQLTTSSSSGGVVEEVQPPRE